jgi:hypothetical protein
MWMSKQDFIAVMVIGFLILVGILCMVFIFTGKDYTDFYKQKLDSGEIVNPVKNELTGEDLDIEEAVNEFDESFVEYFLISIGAYNLHPPLFGSDKPKIEFQISEDSYNAIIDEGDITVTRGEIDDEDIIIHTSKEEAVNIMQDEDYLGESFQQGGSSIEMVAGKTELASKGYLELYNGLTG